MKYKFALNEGPSLKRVVLIAILMALELIAVQLITILTLDRMPTQVELCLAALQGVLLLVTYCLTYLQKTETTTE